MIGIGFAFSSLLIYVFINKKNLKPSDNFIGSNNKKDLIDRARQVIYYRCLSNIVYTMYPVIAAFLVLINIAEGNASGIISNVLFSILLALILSSIAIVFSKLYTFHRVKKAIRYNELRKYIGELWYEIIDDN